MAVSAPPRTDSDQDPVNFIFVGSKLSHTKSSSNARSLLMKEYYRRRRATGSDRSLKGSDNERKTKRRRRSRAKFAVAEENNVDEDQDRPIDAEVAVVPRDSPPPQTSFMTSATTTPSDTHCSLTPPGWTLCGAKGQSSPIAPPTSNPPADLFKDPIAHITTSLDPESRFHVRRYSRLPSALLGIAADVITCMSHDIPLAERFPVLNHAYAAFSSRQMDDSLSRMVHLRNHKALVHTVNVEITRPRDENYNTILLGIQGALASAYIGGDLVEFETHRRGLTHFIIKHGPPKDPDVLIHLVAGCVVFGKSAIEPTLDMSWTVDAASNVYVINHWLAPSQDLISLVQRINNRSYHAHRDFMAADRSTSQRNLFAPGTLLHYAMTSPSFKDPTASAWRQLFDTDHHPFLVIYLTLLCLDLESKPRYDQDLAYALIITIIREYRLTRHIGSVMLNYMLLRLHKRDTHRTWRTFQLHHVLLALPEEHQQNILDLFIWYLCLESEPPKIRLSDIKLWFQSRIAARASQF